ncbi:MAG: phosphoglycerate mutase family protein [Deltaproteobacteria bacterium]|nr:phosphoglycerate mutase family protein [Deltaproteobacteria bacterium]
MEIIIYRHAEPTVSINEKIRGCDFPAGVKKYNESGIIAVKNMGHKEKVVYTSDLLRSMATGRLIGENIVTTPLLRETGIPLIKFQAVYLKANYWMIIARVLWLTGNKTGCESFSEAKARAKLAVNWFESLLSEKERIVVVGHGFINRLIKRELLRRGWLLNQPKVSHGYLSKMIFIKESP